MAEEKKDYLSSLASEIEKKPDSFKEEKIERIQKPSFSLDPKILIGAVAAILVVIVGVYFLFLAPKIKVQDFTGKTTNDVGLWAKENGIDTKNIVMNQVYSVDYDKDVIISQNKKEGSKIKKDTALVFEVSKGADPDEAVSFPDIKNMTLEEINEWVSKNKLAKVKINTVYDDKIEKDVVISFDLKSVNENNFTRGTNLTIQVSKGPQPAGEVTVEDFTKKELSVAESFAKTKKIVLETVQSYHDTITSGQIISQSVKGGDTMKQGDTLQVVVSKGKAVNIPNLVGYTKEQLDAWIANKENGVTVIKKEVYNDKPAGSVIAQSLKAGSQVDQGTVLELTVSLYMPQLQTNSSEWIGKDYLALHAWVDQVNAKGGNIAAGAWGDGAHVDSDLPKGQIVEYACLDGNGNQLPNNCDRPMPINGKISYKVSNGPKEPEKVQVGLSPLGSEGAMKSFCDANAMACSFTYEKTADQTKNGVIEATLSNGALLDPNTMLSRGSSISVKVYYSEIVATIDPTATPTATAGA